MRNALPNRVVGTMYAVLAFIYFCVAFMFTVKYFIGPQYQARSPEILPVVLFALAGIGIAGLLGSVAWCLIHQTRKQFVIVAAYISLIFLPIGTVLGLLILLWVRPKETFDLKPPSTISSANLGANITLKWPKWLWSVPLSLVLIVTWWLVHGALKYRADFQWARRMENLVIAQLEALPPDSEVGRILGPFQQIIDDRSYSGFSHGTLHPGLWMERVAAFQKGRVRMSIHVSTDAAEPFRFSYGIEAPLTLGDGVNVLNVEVMKQL